MKENLYYRKNVRLPYLVSQELENIAKKNKISVNKLIKDILVSHIAEYSNIEERINMKSLEDKLNSMEKQLIELNKNYGWLNRLTKQIFVNSGFAKNRKSKDDFVFQEFVNSKYEE